jgi:hypothetical protein
MKAIPRPALIVGAIGGLPFVVLAVIPWLPVDQGLRLLALQSLINYAALALVFLGAVHWGLGIAGYGDAQPGTVRWGRITWSVVPFGLAFVALYLPPRIAMIELALALIGAQVIDGWAARGGTAPPWYRSLRRPLTAVGVAALVVSVFA